MAATEPIRSKKQLKELANYFLKRGQIRNYAIVIFGSCTALRISDLLRLQWSDVYDEQRKEARSHLTLKEKKTGKTKTIALNKQIQKALRLLRSHKRSAYLFAGNRKEGKAISRVQAWRVLRAAVALVGIAGKISCHSLHKSWGYHAWVGGAVSPVVIMEILNHSSYEITRRYLGVAQDDLDRAYLCIALF